MSDHRPSHFSVATAASVVTLGAVLLLGVWSAVGLPAVAVSQWGPGFDRRIAVSGFGRAMVVLVPLIAIPVVVYAGSSMRGDRGLRRLLALFIAFTLAMELLVTAADLLTLLIGWELVGACSWALIGFEWRDQRRVRAALEAYLTTRVGDLGLYLAAAVLLGATSSFRFDALPLVHGTALGWIAGGILFAAAAKSAQVPFSPWLFSAMQGPTPASALLHSATMVAAGAYLLIRLSPALLAVPWFGPAAVAIGLLTALAGGLVAATQRDLKKALAGSTSAQYGMMFVAIGVAAPGAAGLHLVTHAVFKALLFLVAGIVLHATGTLDLGVISARRLGSRMPRVAWLAAVGTLSLAAVPPLGGAFSKEGIVAAAALPPRGGVLLMLGLLAAGILSAFYATRLQLLAFAVQRGPVTAPGAALLAEVPRRAEVASVALLALLAVVSGLLWLAPVARAAESLVGTLPGGLSWEMAASLTAVVAGVLAAVLPWARGSRLFTATPSVAVATTADWLGLPMLGRRLIRSPLIATSHALARLDDRAVDAGIRGVVGLASAVSGALAWWGERTVAGAVAALARFAERVAQRSGRDDDRLIDGAVEGLARGVGMAGAASRRLQSGLAHDYYALAAAGTLVLVLVAAGVVYLC